MVASYLFCNKVLKSPKYLGAPFRFVLFNQSTVSVCVAGCLARQAGVLNP